MSKEFLKSKNSQVSFDVLCFKLDIEPAQLRSLLTFKRRYNRVEKISRNQAQRLAGVGINALFLFDVGDITLPGFTVDDVRQKIRDYFAPKDIFNTRRREFMEKVKDMIEFSLDKEQPHTQGDIFRLLGGHGVGRRRVEIALRELVKERRIVKEICAFRHEYFLPLDSDYKT